MTCNDAEPLIARFADDESSVPAGVRGELVSHVAACAACRAALDGQRDVAELLRARPASTPRPGLVARVSARLDNEGGRAAEDGWLGLANWRGWTAALVPLAATLLVAAYMDLGRAATTVSNAVAPTFDELTIGDVPAILQPSATGDALMEAVLTGAAPSSGDVDVR